LQPTTQIEKISDGESTIAFLWIGCRMRQRLEAVTRAVERRRHCRARHRGPSGIPDAVSVVSAQGGGLGTAI